MGIGLVDAGSRVFPAESNKARSIVSFGKG